MNNIQNRSNYTHNCFYCKDSGFVVANHRTNQAIYAFLCNNCGRGKTKSPRIPVWNTRFQGDFSVEWEIKPIKSTTIIDKKALAANPSDFSEYSDEDCPF